MKQFLFFFCCSLAIFAGQFDVVIPIHKKDAKNIDVVIDAIEKNIKGVRRIIIVSKEKYSDRAEWVDEACYPFSIEDVAREVGGMGGIGDNPRKGWYYQQILKLYSHFVIEGLTEHILIFDGDTVPAHEMEFIDEDGKPYMDIIAYGSFIHTYYPHVRKLLPRRLLINKKVNPIVHHMMFSKSIIEDLFARVEEKHEKPFWQAFCNLVVDPEYATKQQFYTGASEYMIYYYFVENYHLDSVHVRYVKLYDKAPSLTMEFPVFADFASKHNYNR